MQRGCGGCAAGRRQVCLAWNVAGRRPLLCGRRMGPGQPFLRQIRQCLKAVQDGIADETGVNDKHMVIGDVEQIRDPQGIGFIDVTIRGGAK